MLGDIELLAAPGLGLFTNPIGSEFIVGSRQRTAEALTSAVIPVGGSATLNSTLIMDRAYPQSGRAYLVEWGQLAFIAGVAFEITSAGFAIVTGGNGFVFTLGVDNFTLASSTFAASLITVYPVVVTSDDLTALAAASQSQNNGPLILQSVISATNNSTGPAPFTARPALIWRAIDGVYG